MGYKYNEWGLLISQTANVVIVSSTSYDKFWINLAEKNINKALDCCHELQFNNGHVAQIILNSNKKEEMPLKKLKDMTVSLTATKTELSSGGTVDVLC